MPNSAEIPVPGQIARIRQRLYLVEDTVPAQGPSESTLVRLSCVDDDAQGQPLEVLWEREIGPEIRTGEAWGEIAKRGFDEPRLFAAYMNTLRWNCVTATNPRLLQSPFRAGIRRDSYQLDPLRKALLLPRVNLFVADDVGLGKTIEAGLISRELLLRKKVREIVVCCPPSMLLQWKDELEARFGLTFEILDKDYVKRVRRERGFGVNPWTTHSRFLVSVLSSLLDEYRELREQRLSGETKRKRASAGLLVVGLQQRLLSSIEAFSRTLRVHRRTVQRQWEQSQAASPHETTGPTQTDLLFGSVGSDDDRASLSEAELQAEEDAQIEAATAESVPSAADSGAAKLFAREQRLLDEMTEIAEAAAGQPDARVRELIDWMRKHMCPDLPRPGQRRPASPPIWNDTRVLIFTEYDDTKRYLRQQLEAAIEGADRAGERIEVFHGPTPPDKREELKQAFNADPKKHPVRILIATDAAREGLNLQAHCWNLFHFDVPWNPSRMEQRNGRIDRKLQPRDEVFCHYFVYVQRPEDRILEVLVEKTKKIKEELGSLAQVIDAKLEKTLRGGIRRKRLGALEKEIREADLDPDRRSTVEEELEAARERQDDLRNQIDSLRNLLEDSQKSIGLTEQHFRSAISCGLGLVGAEPLRADDGGDAPPRFAFPALDQREGADPTWADTMDTLRAPPPPRSEVLGMAAHLADPADRVPGPGRGR
jgi:superfamily II DNA/RNA helicase